jgi:hypothetical protein
MNHGGAELFHLEDSITLRPSIPYDFTRLFSMMTDGQRLVVYDASDELVAKLKRAKNAKGKFDLTKGDSGWAISFTKGA